jgi:Transcription initiation factor IIF, alpha subunit (TFIIF-alpha)
MQCVRAAVSLMGYSAFQTGVLPFRSGGSAKRWVLEHPPGHPAFLGSLEGAISGGAAPAGYFLLVKAAKEKAFVALPVAEWHSFRPVYRWRRKATFGTKA